jgi:thiamine pyrophosphate-dependent acetolactate synthase large subunit-like protein
LSDAAQVISLYAPGRSGSIGPRIVGSRDRAPREDYSPDFVAFARAHHAGGSRVETAEGLVPALERAFQEGGVQLVAVPIDYSENTRVLVDELRKHA